MTNLKTEEFDFHDVIITFDAHVDIRNTFNTPDEKEGQLDLQKLKQGNLDLVNLTLYTETTAPSEKNYLAAKTVIFNKLKTIKEWVKQNPSLLDFVYNSPDFERVAFSKKRRGILLSFQNAFWFNDLDTIDKLYDEGVRIFAFNHTGNNAFSGSSRPIAAYGDKENQGLTPLGFDAVKKLNDLGIVIDVSQASKQSVLDTVAASRHPVVATHSGARAVVDNARNLSDEELDAIAAKGGIVHVVAFSNYLKNSPERLEEYKKQILEPFGLTYLGGDPKEKLSEADYKKYKENYLKFSNSSWKYATLEDYLDSIDYIVKRIGAEHVGIASDFNHGGGVVGYSHAGEAKNITSALLKRGYSEADIRKLWGRNFFFLLDKIEKDSKNNPWGVSK